jgi:membrane fusion protein (multidrug efflux system)
MFLISRITPLIFAALMLIVSVRCAKMSEKTDVSSVLDNQIKPTEVLTTRAERREFEYNIITNGKIESAEEVQIQFKVDGIVSEILTANGKYVHNGDIIARIEADQYSLELRKAEVELKDKSIRFQDMTVGFPPNDTSRLNGIKTNLKYLSGLAAAEISYQSAKLNYERTYVRALMPGVVSNLNFRQSSPAKRGDQYCIIHNPNSMVVSCKVLESEAFQMKIGHRAEIRPLFDKTKIFYGKIVSVNPRIDVENGLMEIKIALEKSGELLPGMNMGILIAIPYKKNIIVPKEAIVIRSGKKVIFTEANGSAKWNYVITGLDNGKDVEVLEGLDENEKVIIKNNLQLAHNSQVISSN